MVAQYENIFLWKVLGFAFWKLYAAGVTAGTQKYKNIKDGADFKVSDGRQWRWRGFANTEKISALACFVYFYYSRENASQTTDQGEAQAQLDNAKKVSPEFKQKKAWNAMVEDLRVLWWMLEDGVDESGAKLYPDFKIGETNHCEFQPLNMVF